MRVDLDCGISQGTNPLFHPAQGLELELPRHATAKCARAGKGRSDAPTLRRSELGSSRAQTPPGAPPSRASARSRFNAARRIVGLALVCFFASGVAWADDPALTDVTANPASIELGDSSALQWTPREDVQEVLINGGGLTDEPATGTSHVVMPRETTTYTLEAYDQEGAELGTFELTVTVRPTWADDPALTDVTANPASIELGDSSALQWTPREDVANVVVTLPDGTTADVEPLEGRYEVTPDAVGKFTYTLEAYDQEGAELGTFELTVTVRPTWADDPALTDVTANPASIELGDSSALQWTPREDVQEVLINGGGLTDEPATGTSHVVMPRETTTYTLEAYDQEGAELGTFELTVTVRPTWADDPALTDVTANPASIELGDSSALQWTPREDVQEVLINGGGLTDEPATGTSHVVMPRETTTYTLEAYDQEGAELGTFELTVTVRPTWADDPALTDVTANPASIELGDSSALQWTPREDVQEVLINGGGLTDEPATGTSHVVMPRETTTYTLEAYDQEGAELGTFELTVTVRPTWADDPALTDVTANPASIELGDSSALQWTPREDVANVVVTLPDGTTADVEPLEGRYEVTPDAVGKFTYTLEAYDEEGALLVTGGPFEATVTVTPVRPTWADDPALTDVTANPASIELGDSSALQWTPREDVQEVLINGGGLTDEPATGTSHVVMPRETTTYTLEAYDQEGAELGTFELTVTVRPTWADDPALTDVTANPASIELGDSSALQWTPREDVANVVVTLPDGTTADVEPLEGRYEVTPDAVGKFTYTLEAYDEEGALLVTGGPFEATVTVTPVRPTWADDPALTDVTANPASIELGDSSALQWTPREDVQEVLINGGGLTDEPATGTSHVVMPRETTTYTLEAYDQEGAELGTFELTVTVRPTWADDPALTDVTANPASIELGDSSALQWTPREDVANVVVTLPDGTTADVEPLEGRYEVTPDAVGKFTYTLEAYDEEGALLVTGGPFEATVTVTPVRPTWADDPALTDVTANPASIELGDSSALQWTPREDVQEVLINGGGLTDEPATGTSHVVMPRETTTYTLEAYDQEGAELGTFELTVTVRPTWADDPALTDVTANPASIELGDSSALQWTPREDVANVVVTLPDGTTADVEPLEGRYEVTPDAVGKFTYTLEAYDEEGALLVTGGPFEATVTVTPVRPTWADDPALTDVTANPASIELGDSSALQWTPREDVQEVLINGGGLTDEPATGTSHVVMPRETTTYTLEAYDQEGAELGTFELTVTVRPTWADDPALTDVTANPASIELGDSSALQWTPREDVANVVVTLPDGTTADVEPLEGRYEVTPDAVGKFTYTLEAYDEEGALLVTGGPFEATVTVTPVRPTPPPPPVNRAPVAQDDEGPEVKFGGSVTIDAATLTANDADADGDTLTVTAVSNPRHGTASLSGGTITFEHDGESDAAEGYAFTYTVSDGNGGTDTATVSGTVVPVNRAPVAQDDEGPEVKFGGSVTIDAATLTANDADADGDTLTVTAVSNPQHGTASLSGGTITFEHDGESDAAEGYAFTYTVSDGNGGTDTATVSGTVVPVNRAPVAQDDEGPEVKFGGSVDD